jgi:hypothetical protein
MKPTGKKRYRVTRTWFGEPKLVLQIEVLVDSYHEVGGGYIDHEQTTVWRDAKIEDFELEGKAK